MTWDALRKSINGLVNKVNASNIKHILPEVFAEVSAATSAAPLPRPLPRCCTRNRSACVVSPPWVPSSLCFSAWAAFGHLLLSRDPLAECRPPAALVLCAAEPGAWPRPVLPFHHEEPDGLALVHPRWVPRPARQPSCRAPGSTGLASARWSCFVHALPRGSPMHGLLLRPGPAPTLLAGSAALVAVWLPAPTNAPLVVLFALSTASSAVYAALVGVVNTKFPELGELLLHRVVTQVGGLRCGWGGWWGVGGWVGGWGALHTQLRRVGTDSCLPAGLRPTGSHKECRSASELACCLCRCCRWLACLGRRAAGAVVRAPCLWALTPTPLTLLGAAGPRVCSSSGRTSATTSPCAPPPSSSLPTWQTSRCVPHAARELLLLLDLEQRSCCSCWLLSAPRRGRSHAQPAMRPLSRADSQHARCVRHTLNPKRRQIGRAHV